MKILTQYNKEGQKYIDFEIFLKQFKNKNFTLLDTCARKKPLQRILRNYEYQDEDVFVNISRETDETTPFIDCDQLLVEELFKKDIDLDKIHVITANENYAKHSRLNGIYFEFFESGIKETCKDFEVDINKKRHEKKFLCLNYKPTFARKQIVTNLIENNLLDQCSVSFRDDEINLVYDKKFWDVVEETPLIDGWKSLHELESTNFDLVMESEFSYQNSIFIVTESFFTNDVNLHVITEKTFKAILLKMPFIIVGQPYTLKSLQDKGYKTFSHLWDESYDYIIEPYERMKKINELIIDLSKRDVKKLIIDNYDILEYNYRNLLNRKPEKELFNVLQNI